MLEEIVIENLGVISRAHIPLAAGLTAITGETGAGKTMLLTGLDLLLGGKADPDRVRTGTDRALAEGRFALASGSPVADRVEDAGGTLDDDGSLVILRTITAGRSRAHLGGRSVPQGILADLAEHLVTVHGQSDQLRLRSPRRQREALDRFAGSAHARAIEEYHTLWTERQGVDDEVARLVAQRDDRAREAELLRLGLAEVERVDPQPHEDTDIDAELGRLSNVEDLRARAAQAHDAIAGDDFMTGDAPTAIALVDRARRELEAAATLDPELGRAAERAAEVGFQLDEIAADLSGYLQDLAVDPGRLEEANARRAALSQLTRSYGSDIDAVLVWASSAGLRLLDLEGGDERLAALTARRAELNTLLGERAAEISATRQQVGDRLAELVSDELEGLAMAGARLEVDVTPDDPGPWGADAVVMSLRPHPGAPASPLGKGASGGELSRLMLAIEVVLAQAARKERGGAVPTFVFDEIDAGIGGRAALEVGRRLAALARSAQVVVVTHLAQVAAYADQHLVVTKSSDASGDVVTQSGVRVVTAEDRVTELARMLSGQEGSDAARTHAAELLDAADMG